MNETIKGIFSESDGGAISSMRVMSVIALLTAIGIAVVPYFLGECEQGDRMHVLYFLTAAFAPKAVQKFAEKRQT